MSFFSSSATTTVCLSIGLSFFACCAVLKWQCALLFWAEIDAVCPSLLYSRRLRTSFRVRHYRVRHANVQRKVFFVLLQSVRGKRSYTSTRCSLSLSLFLSLSLTHTHSPLSLLYRAYSLFCLFRLPRPFLCGVTPGVSLGNLDLWTRTVGPRLRETRPSVQSGVDGSGDGRGGGEGNARHSRGRTRRRGRGEGLPSRQPQVGLRIRTQEALGQNRACRYVYRTITAHLKTCTADNACCIYLYVTDAYLFFFFFAKVFLLSLSPSTYYKLAPSHTTFFFNAYLDAPLFVCLPPRKNWILTVCVQATPANNAL